MNWDNFNWIITGINVVLTLINLWLLGRFRRPYSRKQLERYNRQWRSNVNFQTFKAIIDEANKTEGRQRQAPDATAPIRVRPESIPGRETGL